MVAALRRRDIELARAYLQIRQILGNQLTVEQVVETVISLVVLLDAVLDDDAPPQIQAVAHELGLGLKRPDERTPAAARAEPSACLRAAVQGMAHRQALLAIREELTKVESPDAVEVEWDGVRSTVEVDRASDAKSLRRLLLKIDNLVEASLADDDSNGVKS